MEIPRSYICGDVSFILPFYMDLSGNLLEYATAQPLCRIVDTYFFAEIKGIDAEYKFADGEFIADNFYYGKPWRIPTKLLYGKMCYLVMSKMRDDFYREF